MPKDQILKRAADCVEQFHLMHHTSSAATTDYSRFSLPRLTNASGQTVYNPTAAGVTSLTAPAGSNVSSSDLAEAEYQRQSSPSGRYSDPATPLPSTPTTSNAAAIAAASSAAAMGFSTSAASLVSSSTPAISSSVHNMGTFKRRRAAPPPWTAVYLQTDPALKHEYQQYKCPS